AQLCYAATGSSLSEPFPYDDVAEFSPDGARAVTTSTDQAVRLWNAATGKPLLARLKHPRRVLAASFSADSTRVLTICRDTTAGVWNATNGQPVTAPLEQPGAVMHARFSGDGTRVITLSNDKTAQIWAATTGAPVTATQDAGNSAVNMHQLMVAFSPDGARVV